MKKVLFVLMICVGQLKIFSQVTFSEQIKIQSKFVSGAIAEATNHDVITFMNTDSGLYISRINNTGFIKWEKLYGSKVSGISAICATPDNGFACFGNMYNIAVDGTQLTLIKFDSIGKIEWSKSLALTYSSFTIYPDQLKLDSKNNFIATYHKQAKQSPFQEAIRLLKFNKNGTLIFQTGFNRIYGGGYQSLRLNDVIETYNKGYLFAMTYQNSIFGTATGYLMFTDSLGNQLSYKNFGPDYFGLDDYDDPSSLFKSNGKYFVIGFYTHWTGEEYKDYYYISSFDENETIIGKGKLIPYNNFSLPHYIKQHNIPIQSAEGYLFNKNTYTNLEYVTRRDNGTYIFNLNRYDSAERICPDFADTTFDYSVTEKNVSFGNEITGPIKSADYIIINQSSFTVKPIHLMNLICSGEELSVAKNNETQNAKSTTVSSTVFPNPAHNAITISIPSAENKQTQVSLFNSNGKLLQSFYTSNITTTLNVASYTNGIYVMKISNTEQTQILKFIKQ